MTTDSMFMNKIAVELKKSQLLMDVYTRNNLVVLYNIAIRQASISSELLQIYSRISHHKRGQIPDELSKS